jgi:hypothetical protein
MSTFNASIINEHGQPETIALPQNDWVRSHALAMGFVLVFALAMPALVFDLISLIY